MSEEQEVQAPAEAPQTEEAPKPAEEAIPGVSLLSEPEPEQGDADIPEWFKQDKYKTVEDQAKAYTELEKKMGGFKGAPEDDYTVPEVQGLDEGVLEDNEMVAWFKEAARESDMDQETFDKFVSGYLSAEQQLITFNRQRELAALGDNAKSRLTDLADWGQGNLSAEQWEIFKGVASTAVGVELLESMIGKTREAKLARDPQTQTMDTSDTAEELRQMRYAKTEAGQLRIAIDPEYKRQVDAAYARKYDEAAA